MVGSALRSRATQRLARCVSGVLLLSVVLSSMLFVACSKEPAPVPPPPQVTVTTPLKQDVTEYYQYNGTLEAVETVEIRARVPGFLEKIHFTPSSEVKTGDLLFTLEQEQYQNLLELAESNYERAIALRLGASTTYDKINQAFKNQAATNAELIESEAMVKQRIAEVKGAKADLEEAKRQLSYTQVVAPINGRVSRSLIDAGNLVGSSEMTLLTTVVRMDPIYVYFDVSERIVLEYLARGKAGNVSTAPQQPPLEIARPNDPHGSYPYRGVVNWVDNKVDQTTGTIRVRGQFANTNRDLFPGLFVRARAPYNVIQDAVVVDENAVGTDIGGKFVFVVDDSGIATRRGITLGPDAPNGHRVVLEGLTHDDRYIVKGIQKARDGAAVTAQNAQPQAGTQAAEPATNTAVSQAASASDDDAAQATFKGE